MHISCLLCCLELCHTSRDFLEFELSGNNEPTVGKYVRTISASLYLKKGKRNLPMSVSECTGKHAWESDCSKQEKQRWGTLIYKINGKHPSMLNPSSPPACHLPSLWKNLPWSSSLGQSVYTAAVLYPGHRNPCWERREGSLFQVETCWAGGKGAAASEDSFSLDPHVKMPQDRHL